MSEHLCLKWNNHSIAFLKGIKNIEIKEKYCDATIVCQGNYFPVHRFVLSTCSEYFEEIFDKIKCPHPYIIFKDIDPKEISLLLSYMYQGEVNVLQNNLPTFIKAAEALKIKGLAVPDDIPNSKENKDEKSRKRGNSNNNATSYAKRRAGDYTPQKNSSHPSHESSLSGNREYIRSNEDLSNSACNEIQNTEHPIKEESIPQELDSKADSAEFDNYFSAQETRPDSYAITDNVGYIKPEPLENTNLSGDGQEWSELDMEFSAAQSFSTTETTAQNDICNMNRRGVEEHRSQGGYSKGEIDAAVGEDHRAKVYSDSVKFKLSSQRFHCTVCKYTSVSATNVKRHIMHKHTGERPHACSLCDVRFTEKISLKRHMMTHTGEKPFQCPHCEHRFSIKMNMQVHIKRKHSEM